MTGPYTKAGYSVVRIWRREPDNLQWFTNLWENAREAADFYELVQHLCPEIDHEQWDKAWQWRTILHEDFDQAVIEFTNALYGWY